jgi:hypothetical protein
MSRITVALVGGSSSRMACQTAAAGTATSIMGNGCLCGWCLKLARGFVRLGALTLKRAVGLWAVKDLLCEVIVWGKKESERRKLM